MNHVLREAARLVVAAVLTVTVCGMATAFADGEDGVAAGQSAAEPLPAVIIRDVAPPEPSPQLKWLKDDLRLTSGLVDVPAMPEEMELLSDIVTELLSGNVTKLLTDNCTRLLSGNSPELLSGNEAELLSGNDTRLLSGNKPELLSGNKVQLFSNVNVSISITESGNNNTTPPPAVARQPLLLQPKKPVRPGAIEGKTTIRPQKHSATKSAKKARRAKRRFEALDTNHDGLLSLEELQGRGTAGDTMAAGTQSP